MKLVNYEQNERLNTVNGEFRPTINAEAYGVNQNGINTFAKALDDASKTWLEIDKQKDYINATNAINEFNQKVTELKFDKDKGLMYQKGMNAQGILPTYLESTQKFQSELAAKYNLRTTDAVNAFNKAVETSKTNDLDGISRYMRGQYEDALSTATQNQINNLNNNLLQTNDVNQQMKTLTLTGDLIEATGKQLGLDDEQIASKKQQNYDLNAKTLLDKTVADNNSETLDKQLTALTGLASENVLTPYRKMYQQMGINKIANNENDFGVIRLAAGDDVNRGMDIMGARIRSRMEAKNKEAMQSGVGANQHLWKLAQYAHNKYGINTEIAYRQLYAEGTEHGELSRLARENHNYAGLTQSEPNGEENKQPREDGTNYYKMYKSDEEFVDDWIEHYIKPNGAVNAQSIDEYADKLKAGGYYGAGAEHYKALMRNAPMTKGGQPVYSEDQIEKAVKQGRENYKGWLTMQMNIEAKQAKDRITAAKIVYNQLIAKGDYVGASSYAHAQAAGAQTDMEKEAWSGTEASMRPKLDSMYEKGLKLNAKQKFELKKYAETHTYEETLAHAQRMYPDKVVDDSFDGVLLEANDNRLKANKIDLTPYDSEIQSALPADKSLRSSFEYGIKQEMLSRKADFESKHGRAPTEAEMHDIFEGALATQTLRSTEKPYFGDGDDYSAPISAASNRAMGIVHVEPVGNHYVRVTYQDGSTRDIYESVYNNMQRRYNDNGD